MVSCSCKLFGYLGILCRHALKIFDVMNIKETIPSHYILKRWTKGATIINPIEITKDKENDPVLEATKRYRHLCSTFVRISTEAAESREGYEVVAECANEIIAKLKDVAKARCKAQVTSSTRFDGSLNNNGAGVFLTIQMLQRWMV